MKNLWLMKMCRIVHKQSEQSHEKSMAHENV